MFRLTRALSAVPEIPVTEGASSLETRWILPGRLDMAMAGWLGRWEPETESREDAYLIDPDTDGLSVKIRAGRALEVKAFRGSPGILRVPGGARGRLESWQKWSFPCHLQGCVPADCWTRVHKLRLTSRFATASGRIRPTARPGEAQCAVELTEIRIDYRRWWSLGFEATGPAGALRAGLEAAAALVFSEILPGGTELRLEDSTSYAQWLRFSFIPGG